MQDCFRAHPEVYAAELEDEEEVERELAARDAAAGAEEAGDAKEAAQPEPVFSARAQDTEDAVTPKPSEQSTQKSEAPAEQQEKREKEDKMDTIDVRAGPAQDAR